MLQRIFQLRQLRWQFSLRALLLLMTLFGVSLVVYRWPWIELKRVHHPEHEITSSTTFRRGWKGNKERHGVETRTVAGHVEAEDEFRDDVLVASRHYDWNGKLTGLNRYPNGPDAPFYFARGDGETWVQQFHFTNYKRDGECREVVNRRRGGEGVAGNWTSTGFFLQGMTVPKDSIRVVQQWRMGKRHGAWSWQTMSGEVLSTAEYRDNELMRWNGEPVVEQFLAWLRPFLAERSAEKTLTRDSGTKWIQWARAWDGLHFSLHVDSDSQRQTPLANLIVQIDGPFPRESKLRDGQSLPAALCEFALLHGYVFSYRYGLLWLTPQTEAGSVCGDPTGVDRILLDHETADAPTRLPPYFLVRNEWQLRDNLEAALLESGIEYELRGLGMGEAFKPYWSKNSPWLKLSRRDMLGYLLYVNGLRCEQTQNRLTITRRYEVAEPPKEVPSSDPSIVDPFAD